MNNEAAVSEALSHDEAYELLPWFVNGSLSDVERRRVERHLSACLPCRAALRQEERFRQAVAEQSGQAQLAAEGFRQLESRLDRPLGSSSAVRRRGGSRAGRGRWTNRRALAWLTAASVLLVVGALAWTSVRLGLAPPAADFMTVSDPATSGAHSIDLIFADTVDETERNDFFRRLDATVVAGPSDIGRYTIELSDSDRIREQVIAKLRDDPRIRFVGRSFIGENAP
jgi:hypothetical protein